MAFYNGANLKNSTDNCLLLNIWTVINIVDMEISNIIFHYFIYN